MAATRLTFREKRICFSVNLQCAAIVGIRVNVGAALSEVSGR